MDIYKSGISFSDFVNQDTYAYKEKTLQIYEKLEFNKSLIDKIKSVTKKINILICAEIWCPDCMINVPVIEKMRTYNTNIDLSIVGREGNEAFFVRENNDKVKIPTFIVYDENFRELGRFIEHPRMIDDIISSGNQPNIIVAKRKYKKGEYAQETLLDILNIITGDYDYPYNME